MNKAPAVVYRLGATGNYGRPWAWCAGLHWLEGKMGHLPAGEITNRFKPEAGSREESPGLHIDDVGSHWPDWLGHGRGFPGHFVSERVINSLKDAGISYRQATEIPIAAIASPELTKIAPPRYFILEAEIGMSIEAVKASDPRLQA